MKTKKLTKTTVLLFSLSMLVSVIAFFCVPQITEAGIGMEAANGLPMAVAAVLGVAVLVAAVMLRKDMSGGGSWAAAIGRVAVLAAAYTNSFFQFLHIWQIEETEAAMYNSSVYLHKKARRKNA